MNCPKCDHPQGDDVVQCEACGVVIAKYREMQLEAHQSALYGELGEDEGDAGLTGRTITAIAAGLALVAIVVWLLLAADDDLPHASRRPSLSLGRGNRFTDPRRCRRRTHGYCYGYARNAGRRGCGARSRCHRLD